MLDTLRRAPRCDARGWSALLVKATKRVRVASVPAARLAWPLPRPSPRRPTWPHWCTFHRSRSGC